jgi:hypothetical protein
MNTALADQARAASRDARRVIELVVQETAVDGRFTRFDGEPGPFAREMLEGIRKADKRGRLRYCRHLPRRGPAPAWVFGWRPGRLFCHRCAQTELIFVRATAEENTCDVCRDTFPKLWVVLGAAGPFLITFGACRPCFQAETGRVAA